VTQLRARSAAYGAFKQACEMMKDLTAMLTLLQGCRGGAASRLTLPARGWLLALPASPMLGAGGALLLAMPSLGV